MLTVYLTGIALILLNQFWDSWHLHSIDSFGLEIWYVCVCVCVIIHTQIHIHTLMAITNRNRNLVCVCFIHTHNTYMYFIGYHEALCFSLPWEVLHIVLLTPRCCVLIPSLLFRYSNVFIFKHGSSSSQSSG